MLRYARVVQPVTQSAQSHEIREFAERVRHEIVQRPPEVLACCLAHLPAESIEFAAFAPHGLPPTPLRAASLVRSTVGSCPSFPEPCAARSTAGELSVSPHCAGVASTMRWPSRPHVGHMKCPSFSTSRSENNMHRLSSLQVMTREPVESRTSLPHARWNGGRASWVIVSLMW